jgi:hypothetical protein
MSKIVRDLAPISLNDIPNFTDWPKRLLSLESFGVRHKTEKEVLREYQDEKWGRLLKQVRLLGKPSLLDVEETFVDFGARSPCYDAGKFYLANERQMLDKHLDLYAAVLGPHIKNASCLVELGAGFGSKLFHLASRRSFSRMPLFAGEFTRNGRELISLLSDSLQKSVTVGHCDFRKMELIGLAIPENAVIFTSYAVHYVPQLSSKFVEFLSRLKPRAVVHFEPCYEHYPLNTLHGLMCRRYVELNDYTRNLHSVIDTAQHLRKIRTRIRKNVIGSNPFLPISVIEWFPSP